MNSNETKTVTWTAEHAIGQHVAELNGFTARLTKYTEVPDRYRLLVLDGAGLPVRRLNIDTHYTEDALDVAAQHLLDVAQG